jgi:hypothetical protein
MKRVKLSSLHEGSVFQFDNHEWLNIVTDRMPPDRGSGGTTYVSNNGGSGEEFWDFNDPEVMYFGKGKLVIQVTEPD